MKKFRLLPLLLATLTLLAACSTPTPPVTDDTTPGDDIPVETTPAQTSPAETTPAETTRDPLLKPTAKGRVKNSEFGLRPHKVVCSDPALLEFEAGAVVSNLYGYADGTVTLDIEDCFGHKASATVTVTGDTITVRATPCTESFIEAGQFGAVPGDSIDDTKAIQAAIDAAKPGDTVYIYPGIYVVDHLCMKTGVTLEMYTTMTDAHTGFTKELASQVNRGLVTVLSGVRIMNTPFKTPGRDGYSDFTVRGGVLDMKGTTKGAIIFGKANNVVLENVILKDMKNNHAIQLTGCTNTTVRNCMFAGYTWGGTFTREVLQVEPSTPGATGAVPNSPIQFEEGEFNYGENIEISHCYFGKSDKYGAPLMAIGHHSQAGTANVTGFYIRDNIFDEVLYASIRYCNLVDTEITGNTFISTSKYMNVDHDDAKTPAHIVLYSSTSTTKYTGINSGKSVTVATPQAQSGIHNMKIEGNTFRVGKGSDKRIIYATGSDHTPGLFYEGNLLRQASYDDPKATAFNGYTVCSNYMENIDFVNNTIDIEGQPTYTNFLMYFYRIRGLEVSGNKINYGSAKFSTDAEGIVGLSTRGCTMGDHPDQYVIMTGKQGDVTFKGGAKDISLVASGSFAVNIAVEGGRLEMDSDGNGNATVTPIPDEGYKFEGWQYADGKAVGDKLVVSAGTKLVAKFVKK